MEADLAPEREHDVERFVTFADAVVAIAITLLAIPLLENAGEAARGFDLWWEGSAFRLLGLVISFAVIGRLWWSHHRIFEHLRRMNGLLVWVTFAWLLSIVLLSVSTAITTTVSPTDQAWPFPIYVGVMAVSSLLLTVQSLIVLRRPDLTDGHDVVARRRVIGGAEVTVGFLLVLVVGTAFPRINYLAFFLLAVTGQIGRLVARRIDRAA